MAARLRSVKLKGPISVAYKKVDSLHTCNALQFNIVGTGASRSKAFNEMKELLESHLLFLVKALGEGKKVQFFSPADAEDWNDSKLSEPYDVTFILESADDVASEIRSNDIKKLGPFRKSMRAIELVPA